MSLFKLARGRLALLGVLAVAVLAVFAAGCGSDDSDDGGDSGGASTTAADEKFGDVQLTVGAWGGAIDKQTKASYLDPYAAEGGSTAVFDAAPAAQLARLQAQSKAGNVTWDVLDSVGADAAWPLNAEGLLEPLPADLKSHLEEELGADKVTDFGFTHANIAHVIVCNMDKVDKCPKDMAEFFDVEQFPGSRMFPGVGPLTAAAMAQSASGVSGDEIANEPPDLDAVFAKLDEVKPEVKVFFTSGDQQEQIMRSGEADMGIMWSGRAYALAAQGMNLEINWDGGVYEPSYWAVAKDAPNKDAGFALLRYIADNAEGQAEWAEALHYSVPSPKAIDMVPANIQKELADTPSNFEKIVVPNYPWYAENTEELNKRYQDYVGG
jgi:putative spermidine/putrescine transport system substrate-binding protein